MIVVLQDSPTPAAWSRFTAYLDGIGVRAERLHGEAGEFVALTGRTEALDAERLKAFSFVSELLRTDDAYPLASRKRQPQDSVVRAGSAAIGGGSLTLIAGPCAVESEKQICLAAEGLRLGGATLLRGGAFKPRSSPYAFRGLGKEGLRLLVKAGRETGLPVVSEILDAEALPLFDEVDLIQVGARNMQNYSLLLALSQQDKPVLLKRGLSATYEEWLLSAEYILSGGRAQVVLCERGERSFEPHCRATLDLAAVPVIKRLSHLPILVDPSHAAGAAYAVLPLARAAVACGADGVMTEVHPAPEEAWSDAAQSLTIEAFSALAKQLTALKCCIKQDA